jgi:hypothetical protein
MRISNLLMPPFLTYVKNADVYADGSTIWFLVGRGVKQQHAAGILFPQEVNSKY